jgi:hypothetical protein
MVLPHLTMVASLAREVFHLGLQLEALARAIGDTVDPLAEQAGVTVEDVDRWPSSFERQHGSGPAP